jgi:hypothetical protein
MSRDAAERDRILAENRRREAEVSVGLYAPWDPAEALARSERRLAAALLLHRAGAFPRRGDACLEVGHGSLGWLGDLLSWGLREVDLHGIELDPARLERARESFPSADLRGGDAAELPWPAGTFRLIVASTLFTSILDPARRRAVAGEIERVLATGGALLWYDFATDNPRNPHVRAVSRGELRGLFPGLRGEIRSATLAPPLSRAVAPRSLSLAKLLGAVPFLRTHLLGVLRKV